VDRILGENPGDFPMILGRKRWKSHENPGDFLEVTKKRSVSVTYVLIESNRGGIFEGSSRIIFQICLGATLRTWAMLMIEAQTSSG
jgi:hypothetical protein